MHWLGGLRSLFAVLGMSIALAACTRAPEMADADLLELDAPALAAELAAGRVSAERVTRAVLARIAALDDFGPMLNAVIEINPDAVEIAQAYDRLLRNGGPVGPLHGVPVVLKANIDTGDAMATSAGSLALAGHYAEDDAALVARLRAAGAVIVAKANLSEWANFRSPRSTSGWSSLGGQAKNPYVLDHNPCGSSSGSAVAVAARLAPLAVGTETLGSIVCPASANGVVGIKPTLGLVSQDGVVPVATGQDTAGPFARTVAGAALLLGAMQTVDDQDAPQAYRVSRADLRGLRLGVLRDYPGAGTDPATESAYESWLALLESLGAELVDPAPVPLAPEFAAAVLEAMYFEFRDGIDRYLAGVASGPRTLAALIEFNDGNASAVMPIFGQERLVAAVAYGTLDEPAYAAAVSVTREALRAQLERLFAGQRLDALVAPTYGPMRKIDWANGDARPGFSTAHIAAVSGYPSVVVPAAVIGEMPVAISFVGRPFSEADLIGIAAAFERVRGPFPAPRFLPPGSRE